MATHGGAADSYYKEGGGDPARMQYAQQPQMQYPPQAAGNGYQQPPPNYGQNFQNTGSTPLPAGGKQTFDQAFKLDRPKYNDLWAGILVFSNYPVARTPIELTDPP